MTKSQGLILEWDLLSTSLLCILSHFGNFSSKHSKSNYLKNQCS